MEPPILPQYRGIAALLEGYRPHDPREAQDVACLRRYMAQWPDLLTRQNTALHFTASSLILNAAGTRTLLCWHDLYQSWSWTGGHADSDAAVKAGDLREADAEPCAVSQAPPRLPESPGPRAGGCGGGISCPCGRTKNAARRWRAICI